MLSGSCLDLIWAAGRDLAWIGSGSRWDEDGRSGSGRDPDQTSRGWGGRDLVAIPTKSRGCGVGRVGKELLCGFGLDFAHVLEVKKKACAVVLPFPLPLHPVAAFPLPLHPVHG